MKFRVTLPEEVIEHAGPDLVMRAVCSLGPAGNEFIIVAKDEMTYLQARVCKPGFTLEYQEGSLDKHYQAISRVPGHELDTAFKAYADGDDLWKEMFLWTKLHLTEASEVKGQENRRKHAEPSGPMTVYEALSIFGVSPRVSKEKLREIYRRRIGKCHPDRVQTMDDDFKELAEEKSKVLNEAYRILLHRF